MAVRKILQIGDPKLKKKNKIIKKFGDHNVKRIIKDLVDTMRKNNLIGIAAPQIGENYQIFVTETIKTETRSANQTDKLRIYINPRIVYSSKGENIIYEGCGCVANGGLFGPVKRPRQVKIEAYDEKKQKFQLECDGILARVIQHEYDHLSGIEFIERIFDYKKLVNRDFYIRKIKNSEQQTEASVISVKHYSKLTA
ncbi:MAG: peptide deformylase [Candidatus Moraniibacteriota bacterium]